MKNTRESKNARGFTLIEVVIVIAVMGIFGLITTVFSFINFAEIFVSKSNDISHLEALQYNNSIQ